MRFIQILSIFFASLFASFGLFGINRVHAASVNEKSLNIRYKDIKLVGHLYVPEHHEEQMPAVILSHGLGGDYTQMEPYAKALAKQGYLTYAYDFAGGSSNSASTGRNTRQMSVFTEEEDLTAVLNNIRQRSDVDASKVSLVGASQGGLVSALTASQHQREVHSLGLLYPAFSAGDEAQSRYSSINEVPQSVNLYGTEVGRPYYRRLLKTNVMNLATRYNGPTIIIHGSADRIVPVRYARQAAQKFPHAQLEIIKGANHDFPGSAEGKSIRMLDRFFEQHQ
ncbi:alpha/beta hydrolase [Limosilactobacillus albertensis]|uniref:Alpha/beta fold hydrolase n=1 Tax=Limosilactobacillus albertensis TaxID=2759752 RepID=A0A839H600_9LACO|nr:alpha/beta fold hydrolase [Limosilactobacillus albertensis]MBB1124150.1 alpha/beta fold hydrolase [Limosilactobacillus albertensis]MCD7122060.1 alpha/beta hydrolase [Limosilactobacillus albertensis]